MDSQHRHELQENDLANALTGARSIWNDKDWWTRYGNKILLVLLLLSSAFLAKTWADNRTAAAHEQQWADLGMANSPESLDGVASSYSDTTVKSLALLRAGDLLAQRAAAGEMVVTSFTDPTATQPSTVTTDPAKDAADAILRYQKVIGMDRVNPLVRLNAMLGLASTYEDQKDWTNAKATYEQVMDQGKDVSPILAVRAKNRLEILPRLSEPVVFAPEPVVSDAQTPNGVNAPLPGLGTVPMAPRNTTPAAPVTPEATDAPAAE